MLYVIDESSFLVKTIPSYYSSLMLGTAIPTAIKPFRL